MWFYSTRHERSSNQSFVIDNLYFVYSSLTDSLFLYSSEKQVPVKKEEGSGSPTPR